MSSAGMKLTINNEIYQAYTAHGDIYAIAIGYENTVDIYLMGSNAAQKITRYKSVLSKGARFSCEFHEANPLKENVFSFTKEACNASLQTVKKIQLKSSEGHLSSDVSRYYQKFRGVLANSKNCSLERVLNEIRIVEKEIYESPPKSPLVKKAQNQFIDFQYIRNVSFGKFPEKWGFRRGLINKFT